MQEHFKGRIIRRMLGEQKFKEFAQDYDNYKAINIYKQIFKPSLTEQTKRALHRIRQFDF